MAINENVLALGIIGLGVALLAGYMAHIGVDVETYPDVEIAANVGLNAPLNAGYGDYLHPSGHPGPVTYTPHRYPNVSGPNITALIHHGFSPLAKRAPSDDKWITQPPSNVMWLCQKHIRNPALAGAGEIS